jgi:hypothetical protein
MSMICRPFLLPSASTMIFLSLMIDFLDSANLSPDYQQVRKIMVFPDISQNSAFFFVNIIKSILSETHRISECYF